MSDIQDPTNRRLHIRLDLSPSCQIKLPDQSFVRSQLINISTEGACVEFPKDHPLPPAGQTVHLYIEWSEPAAIWVRTEHIEAIVRHAHDNKHQIGLQFTEARHTLARIEGESLATSSDDPEADDDNSTPAETDS